MEIKLLVSECFVEKVAMVDCLLHKEVVTISVLLIVLRF